MASSTIHKTIKTDTVSGTTAASGWLVTSLKSANIQIISARMENDAYAVVPAVINNGDWWFLVFEVGNSDSYRLHGVSSKQVTIEYKYI